MRPARACLLLFAAGLPTEAVSGGDLRVAVASNFRRPMEALVERFETRSGLEVVLSFGSTGKHYAQILNGAPFDLFLAADARRPGLLEEAGRTVPGERFTYALGRLVLWSPQRGLVDGEGGVLREDRFDRLALANPRLAPYGEAARQVLERLALWDRLEPRLVRGENVAQAFQFVASGNAQLGFVARSQLVGPEEAPRAGSAWTVPASLHEPIEQQAVLLRDAPGGRALLKHLRSPESQALLRAHGYDTP